MKELCKSKTDVKLAGVCGGIAEYYEIDVTIVRLVWVMFVFGFGTGVLAYIVAAFIMPDAPDDWRRKNYREDVSPRR